MNRLFTPRKSKVGKPLESRIPDIKLKLNGVNGALCSGGYDEGVH